jgi:hypothetical protein
MPTPAVFRLGKCKCLTATRLTTRLSSLAHAAHYNMERPRFAIRYSRAQFRQRAYLKTYLGQLFGSGIGGVRLQPDL